MENKSVATKEQIDKLDVMISVAADTALIVSKIQNAFPYPTSSREKALVITKLEEAILWTKEDISRNHQL